MKTKISTDPSQDALSATLYKAAEILNYSANEVVTRRILNKPTGNVIAMACDAGVVMEEKISAFDTLVQVLDGSLEIRIDSRMHRLETGDFIIVPAHFRSLLRAEARFKILLTVIKSGYENSI